MHSSNIQALNELAGHDPHVPDERHAFRQGLRRRAGFKRSEFVPDGRRLARPYCKPALRRRQIAVPDADLILARRQRQSS